MDNLWPLIFVFIAGGILLPVILVRVFGLGKNKLPLHEESKRALKNMSRANKALVYRLVQCDCGVNDKCPQGRDPQAVGGNPYRCKIWKAM